jgi:hypothetical protein
MSRLSLIVIILLMVITWAAYFVFYAHPRLTQPRGHKHDGSNNTNVTFPQRKP